MPPQPTKKPTRSSAMKPATRHPVLSVAPRPLWELRLKELEAFKKEYGHCNVPSNYSPNLPLQGGCASSDIKRSLERLPRSWPAVWMDSASPGCYVVVKSVAGTGI